MKKWTAAIYLAVVCGIFAASGMACGVASGCYSCDKGDGNVVPDTGDDTQDEGRLATPVVTLDGNNAVWDVIDGALGYEYKINGGSSGMIANPNTTYFALKHNQTFKVRALGATVEEDGDWSNEVTYTASSTLALPVVTINEQGFASWTAVVGAANGYEYLITDKDDTTEDVIGTTTKTTMDFALSVGQSITVRALGDEITYASGDWCAPIECTKIVQGGTDVEENERPDEPIVKPDGGEGVVFDESKLGNMLNYKQSFTAEVGEKANIPIVYVQYDNDWYEAFPWVTCENEKVEIGGRGTRFYVNSLETHIIDYYVEIGGVQKIATTTVTIKDTQGPTFDLPSSADGMLVYVNEPAALPDWTAFDYSGIKDGDSDSQYSKNGVTISVTYNGNPITVTNGKFTPNAFGDYKVTYSATDTKNNVGSTTFTVKCTPMVELCNFDSLEVGSAWSYYQGEGTLGELSEEHRYGDSGHSLKVTTRGTGEGGFIKVIAIPNYYDLSGFDEIAFTIYASESLQGTSAGIYLLNNEALYRNPYNLDKGENLVRFTREQIAQDYAGGKLLNAPNEYRSSDHIWLQFRGPKGVELYIDNMVGVFYEETGSDLEAPIVDLGAGVARAESKLESGTTYQGAYGNISVTAGDTIQSAIDKNVHVCDNSMNVTWDYTVTQNGADVTAAVKSGKVGVFGETYTLTVTAKDGSNRTTTKSTEIVVRQAFPTYTKVGMEEITLNYGNDANSVKLESSASVKVNNQIDKNGKVEVKTVTTNEVMYVTLTIPDVATGERRALTVADVQAMEYLNFKLFIQDAGVEFSLGNGTLLCRSTSGWNDITIDKATLIAAMNGGAYNTETGALKLNLHCALGLPFKMTVYEVKGVYTEGNMPYEKELQILNTPQVTIDPTTGIASWEAVENAVSYTVYVNGVAQTPTQTATNYQLSDEQTIEVRANGDGINYDSGENNGMSIAKTYYVGKVLLNSADDLIFFDTSAQEALDSTHRLEGKFSTKLTTTANWSVMYTYLRIDDVALSKSDWLQYEYVEFNVYTETAGQRLYIYNTHFATIEQTGWSTVRLTTKMLLDQVDANPTVEPGIYANGFLYLQLADAGYTVYFDKIMAVIGNGSAYVPPQSGDEGDTPETPETTVVGKLVNRCEVAANYWLNGQGMIVSTNSSIKTEGASSLKVENTANAYRYIIAHLRDYANGDLPLTWEQVQSYDYLYLDVYYEKANASYFAPTDEVSAPPDTANLFLYDCVAAQLKEGWNQVRIDMATIVEQYNASVAAGAVPQYREGEFYFAVGTACTLYFDNIQLAYNG